MSDEKSKSLSIKVPAALKLRPQRSRIIKVTFVYGEEAVVMQFHSLDCVLKLKKIVRNEFFDDDVPLADIILLDGGKKLWTPDEVGSYATTEQTLTIVRLSEFSRAKSYEIYDRALIEEMEHLKKRNIGLRKLSSEVKTIHLYDSNVLIFYAAARLPEDFLPTGDVGGYPIHVLNELQHSQSGKVAKFSVANPGVSVFETKEFPYPRLSQLCYAMYPILLDGKVSKSGIVYPPLSDLPIGSSSDGLLRDMMIWFEAFVIAGQYSRPVKLHTFDNDFALFVKDDKAKSLLIDMFTSSSVDLVSIEVHNRAGMVQK